MDRGGQVTFAWTPLAVDPLLCLWLTPTLAGLGLSVPLSMLSSRGRWGQYARRLGLFTIPEEIAPPPLLRLFAERQHSPAAPGADVDIAGSVRFGPAPGGRGTEIKVILTYAPPAGKLGAVAASLLGQGGDRLVRETLRRFKQLMETGEVPVGAVAGAAAAMPPATASRGGARSPSP